MTYSLYVVCIVDFASEDKTQLKNSYDKYKGSESDDDCTTYLHKLKSD